MKYAEFNGAFHSLCFRTEMPMPFLGKFDPKSQIVSLSLKLY